MKIPSITTEEFRWPRHVPIRNGKHTYTHSGLGIVKIETDEKERIHRFNRAIEDCQPARRRPSLDFPSFGILGRRSRGKIRTPRRLVQNETPHCSMTSKRFAKPIRK